MTTCLAFFLSYELDVFSSSRFVCINFLRELKITQQMSEFYLWECFLSLIKNKTKQNISKKKQQKKKTKNKKRKISIVTALVVFSILFAEKINPRISFFSRGGCLHQFMKQFCMRMVWFLCLMAYQLFVGNFITGQIFQTFELAPSTNLSVLLISSHTCIREE